MYAIRSYYALPIVSVPAHIQHPPLSEAQEQELTDKIKRLLKEKNAVLVAHYYTDGKLQKLAEQTGGCVADSLEMARFGRITSYNVCYTKLLRTKIPAQRLKRGAGIRR